MHSLCIESESGMVEAQRCLERYPGHLHLLCILQCISSIVASEKLHWFLSFKARTSIDISHTLV